MKFKSKNRMSTETLALGAILTALVIVLQFIAAMLVRLGLFSVSLVLIPIVIGVATCGIGMGAWLGFVFGVVVLFSGDAAAFWAVDVLGTVVTVLVKGIACGLGNIQKVRDGEPLGGKASAASDFDTDEDDDFLA